MSTCSLRSLLEIAGYSATNDELLNNKHQNGLEQSPVVLWSYAFLETEPCLDDFVVFENFSEDILISLSYTVSHVCVCIFLIILASHIRTYVYRVCHD